MKIKIKRALIAIFYLNRKRSHYSLDVEYEKINYKINESKDENIIFNHSKKKNPIKYKCRCNHNDNIHDLSIIRRKMKNKYNCERNIIDNYSTIKLNFII